MKTQSVLFRYHHFHFFRHTAVALVALAWACLAFGGEIHDAANKGDLEKVKSLVKDLWIEWRMAGPGIKLSDAA